MGMLAEQLRAIIEGPLGTEKVTEEAVAKKVGAIRQNERRHVFGVVVYRDGDDQYFANDRQVPLSRREVVEAVKKDLEGKGRLDEKLGLGALMAMGDQQKAVDAAEAQIGQSFKKVAKRYTQALDKMTGAKWRVVSASESIFSLDSDEDPKRAIDIYWEYDPGSQTATIYVEGPGGKQKAYNRQKLGDVTKRNYIDWLSRTLKEDMEAILTMALTEDESLEEATELLIERGIRLSHSQRAVFSALYGLKKPNVMTVDEIKAHVRKFQAKDVPRVEKALEYLKKKGVVVQSGDRWTLKPEWGKPGAPLKFAPGEMGDPKKMDYEVQILNPPGGPKGWHAPERAMTLNRAKEILRRYLKGAPMSAGGEGGEHGRDEVRIFQKSSGKVVYTGLQEPKRAWEETDDLVEGQLGRKLAALDVVIKNQKRYGRSTLIGKGVDRVSRDEAQWMVNKRIAQWVERSGGEKAVSVDASSKRLWDFRNDLEAQAYESRSDDPRQSLIEEIQGIIDEAAVVAYRRSVSKAPPLRVGKPSKPTRVPSGTKVGILFKQLVKALTRGGDWDAAIKALRHEGVPENHINYAIKYKEVPYVYQEDVEDDGEEGNPLDGNILVAGNPYD